MTERSSKPTGKRPEKSGKRRPNVTSRSKKSPSRTQKADTWSPKPASHSEESSYRTRKPGARSGKSASHSEESSYRTRKPGARSGKSESRSEESSYRTRKPGARSGKSESRSRGRITSDEKPDRRRTLAGHRSGQPAASTQEQETIRLNKYIAHAGICSRRDADTFISDGKVTVNGKVVTELGYQVNPGDRITVSGQKIEPEPFVYILMNKPRDTITTTSDEKGRKTVMDLVENATGLRLYPVGRLDRNTTGLILLTNDGDLANRLMHPSYKVRKVYDVETDRMLTDEELGKIRSGIPLEDGPAQAYRVTRHPQYLNVVTLSMHEGRNRIVRRMMESLGVEVLSLDRVGYGPLQKKGLRVGRWRNLRKTEINELRKMVKLLPMDHLNRS